MKVVIPLLIILFSLCGCQSESVDNDGGHSLKVGVVGSPPEIIIDYVEYTMVDIDELFEHEGMFDALFVMQDTFKETSQSKYVALYDALPYPVFFIEFNGPTEVFISEDFTIEDFVESQSTAFASGYYQHDYGSKRWYFVPPSPLEKDSDYREMYIEILQAIVAIKPNE